MHSHFHLCFLLNTCRIIFNICDQQNQAAFVSIDNQSYLIIKSGTYKSLKTYFIFEIFKQCQEPRIQQNWGTSFDNLFSDTVGRTISVKIIIFGGFSKGQSADLVTQQETATRKGQVKTTNGHVFMSTQVINICICSRN